MALGEQSIDITINGISDYFRYPVSAYPDDFGVCPSGIGKGSQGYAGRKALEHNGNKTQNP